MRITTLIMLLFLYTTSSASHMMGGEITWKCSNGNYIFTLKVYRDCKGSPFTTAAQTIDVTGHPTITGITVNSISLIDLSQPGCGIDCDVLNDPGIPTGVGSIEEYIFQSAPVNLGNFVPPATGWIFSWNLCCRNSSIQNIAGASGFGMTLRSVMYDVDGATASPCLNSSPAISERPKAVICSGYDFQYSQTAFDPELDSMTYTWDRPVDGSAPGFTVLNYAYPYSINFPVPGIISLNSENGLINYFPPAGTQGDYVTCIRVDEFRCGEKISSTFREMQIGLSNLCQPVNGGGMNQPPAANINGAPYYVEYDTVQAGDTVVFGFNVIDYDINSNSLPQNVIFNAISPQFGTNDTSTSGCLIPPCATLNQSTPISFTVGQAFGFNWVTSCSHLASINGCFQNKKIYDFIFSAVDDGCPTPGLNNYLLRVVVLGPEITAIGNILSVNFPNNGLQWYLNGVAIQGATSSSILASANGIYTVAVTGNSGCGLNSAPFYFGVSEVEANIVNELSEIEVIPNPNSGVFNVSFYSSRSHDYRLELINVYGQIVFKEDIAAGVGKNQFPLFLNVETGVYFLQVYSDKQKTSKRLVIN